MKKNIKIAFFDAKPYDNLSFDAVIEKEYKHIDGYKISIKYFNSRLSKDTAELAKGHSVVCAFVNDTIDKEVIQELKAVGVELVALRCAGYNNVDLKAAFKNLNVVRVPAYSPYAVAEHAVSLMMSLNRKIHRAYFRTRDGNFALNGLLGFDMHDKTAGVIGTGKIGKCLINILLGFGMKVLAYDKFPDEELLKTAGVKYVSLDDLYKNSDVISLHCPLTKETRYLINELSIQKMKDGVMIINTGRGELIDTKALIQALKNKKVGYAGLDVYEEEHDYFFEDFSGSMIGDDVLARLLTFPNVLVTAHQAFFTDEALHNIAKTTLDNILEYFEGDYLKNEVCYQCNLKNSAKCHKKNKKRCF